MIPFAKPGITSGCTMVFMLAAGALAAPQILGGPSSLWFTQIIYRTFFESVNWSRGAAYAVILLVVCTAVRAADDAAVPGEAWARSADEAAEARACGVSVYLVLFFGFLLGPLIIMSITAFNCSAFPRVGAVGVPDLRVVRTRLADDTAGDPGLQFTACHRGVRGDPVACRWASPARCC